MSDRLSRLQTLRDQLTAWLADSPADRAQLALRLASVLEQIEACEKAQPQTKGTVLDELNAKRAEREAAGASSPARNSKRR